uniref:Capsid protein n=1 Tax=Tomato dicistro-like virus TaxID=3068821 RepID=A0AA50EAC6_9VIRU|nr:capsid protein [Tomato dicistro-like virus]
MNNNEQGRVDSMIDGDAITKLATTVLGESTTTSTTTFTNQNPTNVVKVLSNVPHDRSIIDSSKTGDVSQMLASFMQKPVAIATGSITSANLAGSQLFKFGIAASLLGNAIWMDKLRGFMNFRGTAKVRLQVNANPFQAGRLILAYIPQYTHAPRTFTTHLTGLMPITQLPHVEMTLQDTECELEIPYIAPTTHFNLFSGLYDWGTVFCYIYSPLATGSGGTNQVTYTAWLSFDGFELEVPIVPQARGMTMAKKDIIKKYRVNAIKSNLDSEVNEGKGPVSSILSNVSSIASTLYSVPMLSPIAGPTAWFSNLMSGLASSFGWSKPILDTPPCRMYSNPHAYLPNTNATDISNNLGIFADNKVSVMPDVNLSGVDEMAMSFIKRQKSWFQTVSWTSTTLPGPLVQISMDPRNFAVSRASLPVGATSKVVPTDYSPIAFLSQFFREWRGSIEIIIKVVKTQYHTGRLIVAFSPDSGVGSITNSDSNYVHREIIDLRDGSEFCVTIPYCNYSTYTDTSTFWSDPRMVLHVNVLNELVAPETCSQSVDLLFEVRGGNDLEFQVPIPFRQSPAQIIEPQSGGDDQAIPVLCNNIGGSSPYGPVSMASSLCIGEHVTSILQLCKRYMRMTSGIALAAQSNMFLYPFTFGGFYSNGVISGGSEGPLNNDYLNAFAACYAHSRGGVRYRLVCDPVSEQDATAGSIVSTLVPYTTATFAPYTLGTANAISSLGIPLNQQVTGIDVNFATSFDGAYASGTGVTVPMYSKTFARLNRVQYSNLNSSFESQLAPDYSRTGLNFATTGTAFGTATSLFRCASDDFQFSFWLGVPTMGMMVPS